MSTAIVLTTAELRKLCRHAEQLKFSTGPNDRFWRDVDPKGTHVVADYFEHRPNFAFWKGIKHQWNFSHNGGMNIRAVVRCKMKGRFVTIVCDFDCEDFRAVARRGRRSAA